MGSFSQLELIRRLVDQCEISHRGPCSAKHDHPLPTRVLDVGTPDTPACIRLFESKGKIGRYIALSYCWGNAPTIKTLSSNLETFKSDISLDSLPRTFKDAIRLTWVLGIQYLWIDSLCIIQDDEADWVREASQMASVYGNSYLTIAASSAQDSTVGIFVPRTTTPHQSFKVKRCNTSEEKTHMEVFVRQRVEQLGGLEWFVGKRLNVKTNRPLDARAWTYQEAILPRRILKMYSDEIHFECESCAYRESIVPRSDVGRGPRIADWEKTPETISDKWRLHVTNYSGRNITFLKDRFTALSGLAREFHKLNQSSYYAGMWEHSILEDLQWHTESETALARLESTEGNRLPTWSWVSTNGRVAWFERSGVTQQYDLHNAARIAYIGCEPASINPFGPLNSAYLLAWGFTLTATIHYETPYKATAARGNGSAFVWPDYDYTVGGWGHVPEGSEVVLFLISTKIIRSFEYEESMLVLRRVTTWEMNERDHAVYERIGYANCPHNDSDISFEGLK